jgi:transcriptional antiterminator NusG
MGSKTARWYVIQTYSGSESRVAQLINEKLEKNGFKDYLKEIYIPSEKVVELKKGVKVDKTRNYFPGYILINIIINEDIIYLIRRIPRVADFVGMNGKPTPISEEEVQKIINRTEESSINPRSITKFEVGTQVRVTDGPFASFSGQIEEIEEDKQRLKVSVIIFGRSTPVTLGYNQVERI